MAASCNTIACCLMKNGMGRAPVDLSLLCEREGCCKVEPLPGIFLCSDVKLRPPYVPSVQPVALIPSVAERLAEVEKVLFPMAEYDPIPIR